MSVDLNWSQLDDELALTCRAFLNRALTATTRPSFLGDIICTDFLFGDTQPDIELVDIRDIYPDFLEADEAAEAEARRANELELGMGSARSASSWQGTGPGGGVGTSASSRRVSPSAAPSIRSAYARSAFSRPAMLPRSQTAPLGGYFDRPTMTRRATGEVFPPSPPPEEDLPPASTSSSSFTSAPSLQLHVKLTYAGTLRLGLKTTLLVNHPSPSFLALPVSLTLSALAFRGTLVLAYQGDRKRLHLSLLDPGPSATSSPTMSMGSISGGGGAGGRMRPADRVLTDLVCESEVGQADKHVLRNVGKVEKFVLDVVRGALEDEIIWPNFQTIAWAGAET